MKHLTKLVVPFAVALVIVVPLGAHAATAEFFGPIISAACQCGNTAPSYGCVLQTIQNVINFAISIGAMLAVLVLAYAGFTWMMNPSNPEKRSQARGMIINVVIGLVVVLAAWLIVDFIMKKLYDSSSYGPWNSILASQSAGDQCIEIKEPTPLTGLGGLIQGAINAPSDTGGSSSAGGGTSTTTGGGSQTGTGPNCPAANPSSMVSFPAAATSGGAEKASQATVNNFMAMRAAAAKDGIDLKVTDGYRSDAEQVQLWNQYGQNTSQVAKPCSLGGNGSNHNSGTAVDIAVGCAKTNSSCRSATYLWLKQNGGQYGFRNALPTDVVHWSPSGR